MTDPAPRASRPLRLLRASPTSAGSARTTRTPGTPARGCSPSATASAARPAATSPPAPRSQQLRRLDDAARPTTCSAGSPAPCTAPTTGSPSWSTRTPRSTAPAPRPPSRSSTARRLGDRPRRRQPRLPLPRRRALPAHHGPHVRAEPHRRGPDHRGGGAGPPAPQPDPQGPRRHPRGRARPVPDRARRRRPAVPVQRRRLRRARRRPDRRHPVERHRPTTPPSSWSAPASRPAAPTTSPAWSPTCVDAVDAADDDEPRAACWSAPPPSCRAPRRAAAKGGLFRGHRSGDTGELEPVEAEIPDDVPFAIPSDPLDPEEAPLRPRAAAPVRLAAAAAGRSPSSSACSGSASPPPGRGPSSSTTSASRTARRDLPRHRRRPARHHALEPYETTDVGSTSSPTTTPARSREGIEAGDLDGRPQHRREPAPRQTGGHRPRTRRTTADAAMAQTRRPDGLRAPAPPGCGAVPARPRARRRHRRLRRRRASASRARSRPTSSAYGGWLAAPDPRPPTSWSAWSRRTPTRCCCRSSPRSTASAWRSSTGSTWPRGRRARRTASPASS